MSVGRVIRSHGGIHYVWLDGDTIECRPRGRMRYDCQDVLAGDWVEVTPAGAGEGRIDQVLPRRTVLTRPPVANVDQAMVVWTLVEPALDLRFLDRVLAHAARTQVATLLVLNKVDLCDPSEAERLLDLYRRAGYRALAVSGLTGIGLTTLTPYLDGQITVLAGQSGVGKSRLTGALLGREVRTGDLSVRGEKGRHTTRHVELLPMSCGGFLADAPGFTYLEFAADDLPHLVEGFPDLHRYSAECRFADCKHRAEPDCAVKAALAAGQIAESRYGHYLEFLTEIESLRKW